MAKIRGELVVRLMFALVLLDIVTASRLEDVPDYEFSSYIDDFEQDWYGKNYPFVTVELLPGNQIRATQKRFQLDPLTVNGTEYTWNISLSYQTKGGNYGRVWMNKTEVIFEIPLNSSDDWILFNYDFSEKCRFKYDDILWDRITKQLNDNHTEFSDRARQQLFSNARNLAKAGQLGYDKVLDLISYASKDRGFALWWNIYDFVNFFKRMIYETPIYSHFQRFMLNVTSSVRDEMTFKDSNDPFEFIIHPMIWSMSCSFGHKDCLEKTTRLFQARLHIEKPKYVSGYQDVDCIGIANSLLESDWNTIFERYKVWKKIQYNRRRLDLLYSLSCSRNFTLLERLLDFNIENEVEPEHHIYGDFYWTMAYIDSHPASNYSALKWLKLNSAKVDKAMTPGSSITELTRLAYNLKTREQRQEVVDFFDNYPAEPHHISMILGKIDRNIRWRDKNLPSIAKWFEENAP